MGAESSTSLRELTSEYWEEKLSDEPVFATVLGYRKFDDRLPDITPEGRVLREKRYLSVLERCRAIREEGLSEVDRMTRAALLVDVGSMLDYSACRLEEWAVDPLQGPQIEFANMESFQPVKSPEEGRAMVRRWAAMGDYFDDYRSNLRRGLEEQRVAVRVCLEKVIEEVGGMLAKPAADSAFARPLLVDHSEWTDEERAEFRGGMMGAISGSVMPSLARLETFLKSEALPKARTEDRPGICHLPGGREAYARLIRVHTSLDLTPDELHETGMAEVSRINSEMTKLGEKVFGLKDRKQIVSKLRTDSSLYFTSRDEVAKKAEESLAKAKAAIPAWFGRLPKADCKVVRMEEHEEKHSTIAYYRQPAANGSRPGSYYINTSAPETRPRYEAEALAYHESIPGHHLQIAIAQELEGIPEFRRNGGVTAFVEGWGLYSERLADQMGLYSSDLDRIGVLSYDAWRACRLVVDTGMHAMKWTRDQAINFMLENTALAKNNIVNEVDRYITWPGQALAYKTGQLEILRLRAAAEKRLGARFGVKRYHDVVLGNGAVPLKALRELAGGYAA